MACWQDNTGPGGWQPIRGWIAVWGHLVALVGLLLAGHQLRIILIRALPYVGLLRTGFGQPVHYWTAGGLLPHHFTLAGPRTRPAEAS